jgi:hypothetical protein
VNFNNLNSCYPSAQVISKLESDGASAHCIWQMV